MIMDTLHVVKQVIPPWKAIARDSALAARVVAEVRPIAMSMHTVCFSFVPEQAGGGRELLLGTSLHLAAERLDVRVDKFARGEGSVSACGTTGWNIEKSAVVLVVALQFSWLVLAAGITLERAVVQSIGLRSFIVQRVSPVTAFVIVSWHHGSSCGRILETGAGNLLRSGTQRLTIRSGDEGANSRKGSISSREATRHISPAVISTLRVLF